MDAVVYIRPGELSLTSRPAPQPRPGEVLVDVTYVGICGSDLLIWAGGMARVQPPVVLGHEFSGVISDPNGCVGISAGDRVAVEPLLECGDCVACRAGDYNVCVRLRLIGIDVDGAAASSVVVPAGRLHRIPDQLSLRDAALAEPSAVALHMARRAGTTMSSRVLVVGGGPIGTIVASVCKHIGVETLVVSEPNPRRRELHHELGLGTFDPTAQGPEELARRAGPDGFDIVFELTGLAAGLATALGAVAPHGTVLLGGLPHGEVPVEVSAAVFKEVTLKGARVYTAKDVADAVELLAAGAIPAGRLVSREVALSDAIDDAYRVLRGGADDMKILITP